ncbi:hypothetical protein LPTSP4_07250 [Leptospira ryugenii]|uniref:Sigma factor regulatory protein, FecR/PupR family n=1 Tax=Leptospira ryugenii TaxID=1917863 RepID=A0A2P2DX48_9LEPT|nr:FecR family protein [Leptospira ryugenii]GBF49215.1 hypothetical protein LPTSP4_07250 [Leptospira ryugenii]
MRLLNDTRFVIPLLLLLIVFFSTLLYLNLNEKKASSDNPTIGILTFKTKTVLRKYNDQVVWDSIESNQEVKNRDTIRTEDLSDAVLTLNDGTKINIAENSMILLDISDKKINVNFAYGSFEAAREQTKDGDVKLNITAGDKVVEVGKGDIKLDKTKDSLSLKVGEGEAKVTANGKEEKVSKDEVANVTNEGLRVSKPKFNLVYPLDKKNILSESGKETITFTIAGLNNSNQSAVKPILEVSSQVDFRNILIKENLKSESVSKPLSIGTYFWRIAYIDPESNTRAVSETHRFRILQIPQLKLYLPKDGEIFSYTSELPVIKLAWSEIDLYSSYTAQIARDVGFTQELKSKSIQGQAISFEGLSDGTYYARVIARSNITDVNEKISSVSKFTIGKRQSLEPPVLVEPNKGKVLSKEEMQGNLFFSWKDNPDYVKYQFELSGSANFANLVVKQTTDAPFLKLNQDLQEGEYYWRVRGLTSSSLESISLVSNFTLVKQEELVLLSPSNNADLDSNEKGTVIFKWKKLTGKVNYRIEISKNNNFNPLLAQDTVTLPYFEWTNRDGGKFFWRVIAEKNEKEQTSPIHSFTLNFQRETPSLLSPTRNEAIDLGAKNAIGFIWKAEERATAYRLKVWDVSGIKERLIINERTTQTKFNFTDFGKLNEGRHRLELLALYPSPEGEKESLPFRSEFFINLPKLSPPKILTPGTIYVE